VQITKLGHSCVLVKTENRIAIFDPGVWSTHFKIDEIEHIDRIVITHEHGDHFDIDKIKQLADKFPDSHLVSNQEVAAKAKAAGIKLMHREETRCTVKFTSSHEQLPIPSVTAPDQNGYHFDQSFTSPGDSHSFSETMGVLAMPLIAPWGNTRDAVNKILELKPEYVLPVHDWHYTEEAKKWLSDLIEPDLEKANIKLLPSHSGITHELSL